MPKPVSTFPPTADRPAGPVAVPEGGGEVALVLPRKCRGERKRDLSTALGRNQLQVALSSLFF